MEQKKEIKQAIACDLCTCCEGCFYSDACGEYTYGDGTFPYVANGYVVARKEAKNEYEAAKTVAIKFIMENLSALEIIGEAEDSNFIVTMPELQSAIEAARTEELKTFVKTGRIPYDGGYIQVIKRNKKKW